MGGRLARRVAGVVVGAAATVLVLGLAVALAVTGLVRSGEYRRGYASDDLLVVLAIGSDIGPPYRPGNPAEGRADGIHLFVVDTAARRMTVVDLPRDLAIGGGKVNAHLARGGPERLEAQLEAWSGLAIDFYAMGSFQSLTAVVETLGGVQVDVPQRMLDAFSGSDLQPGPQVLGPVQALAFTRDRKSLADGDIGRSRNQTRLMLAAMAQVREASVGDMGIVLRTVATLRQHTLTNIPAGEMLPLALTALSIPPDAIEQVTISGPFDFIGAASVIRPQPGDLFQRLNQGQVGPSQ